MLGLLLPYNQRPTGGVLGIVSRKTLNFFNMIVPNDDSILIFGSLLPYLCRFSGSALRVVKSFEDILQQRIAAIAALGVTITASALETNSTWPFVTVNRFQERSASVRSLSGALFLTLAPIVTDENRAAWEEYAVNNSHWLPEAREYQTKNGMIQVDFGLPFPNIAPSSILAYNEAGFFPVDPGVSIGNGVFFLSGMKSYSHFLSSLSSLFDHSLDHTIRVGSRLLFYLHHWPVQTSISDR